MNLTPKINSNCYQEPMETLVEEREADMMLPCVAGSNSKHQPPPIIKRKAFLLKPTSALIHDSLPPKHHTMPSDIEPATHEHLSRIKWWPDPQRQWEQWVEKLKPAYKDLWKKVGIYDAVTASTYKFRKSPSSLWGVARFWSEETNTFVFPWGETTVTLEDVMILGGFSVLGEPVRVDGHLVGELGDVESEIIKGIKSLRGKKFYVEHHTWIRHYIGGNGELEHVAFLSLWLSRYVLPATNKKTVKGSVVQIACRLARGVRIALAPAVLASIYRDLRVMKDQLIEPTAGPLGLRAPLNILQLWVWERFFLYLRPASKRAVRSDEPRAAIWRDMNKTMNFSFVMSALESPDEFHWKPYIVEFDDRCWKPCMYKDDGRWVNIRSDDASENEEVQSFVRCLRTCELVGLDCIEPYLPHRVAMQFGLDQDIPKFVPRVNLRTWKEAWQTYDVKEKNVRFYVPSLLSDSSFTQQYSIWWKNAERTEMVAVAEDKRHIELPLPQRKKKKKGKDTDDFRIGEYCPGSEYHDSSNTFSGNTMRNSLNLSLNRNSDFMREIKIENENQLVQEIASNQNAREFACDLTVIQSPEQIAAVRVKELVGAKRSLEEMKERAAVRLKELKHGQEIEKLKEDIAVCQEISRDLIYLAMMYSK